MSPHFRVISAIDEAVRAARLGNLEPKSADDIADFGYGVSFVEEDIEIEPEAGYPTVVIRTTNET